MRVIAHNGAHIWGGAERATVLLLRGLSDRGHDVMLLCNDPLVKSEAEALAVPAEICAVGGDIALPHALQLARRLKLYRPDTFIIGTWKKLFLASLGARIARVRRVVARVGLETDTPRSAKYRFALRHWVDAVAVNAERMIPPFAALDGFGQKKVVLIHNGVRRPGLANSGVEIRDRLGLSADTFVAGFVGRLAPQKRLDRLLQAIALTDASVHCVVAGDGEERSALVADAHRLGISGRMHFLGHQEDISSFLQSLDVFVISSDREGLSNSMLEAMAVGLPVISTRVSGASDALEGDESAGIIVGFDPAAIAAAIEQLKRDPATRSEMGRAARQRAESTFSFNGMLDRWEAFLSA